MRKLVQNLLMMLIAVILTGGLAVPHICMDDENASITVEQQLQTSSADHQDNKASGNNCCVAHHCCTAKLISPAPDVWKTSFAFKADLPVMDESRPASLGPTSLDRPPKSFA